MEVKTNFKSSNKKTAPLLPLSWGIAEENVERISSNDLSKKMHVTASQIRQDLNNFGGFGQ